MDNANLRDDGWEPNVDPTSERNRHGERQMAIEPPMKVFEEVKIEGLGEITVFSTVGEPAELPDSIAIIGGAPASEPQPMHYFDARGVQAAFLDARRLHVDIWRAAGEDWTGPHGPGFNKRFIGEISGDGRSGWSAGTPSNLDADRGRDNRRPHPGRAGRGLGLDEGMMSRGPNDGFEATPRPPGYGRGTVNRHRLHQLDVQAGRPCKKDTAPARSPA